MATATSLSPERGFITAGRALALLFFTLLLSAQPLDRVVETGPGQWRTKKLNDGSVVRIGPRTRLEIEFDDGNRLVHLQTGEAIFSVAKDVTRPFIVDTDVLAARAVGTKFSVTRLEHRSEVVVAHGLVAVSTLGGTSDDREPQAVHASGGLQITVDKKSQLESRQVDIDDALAWGDGYVVFQRVPIADAIAQFNRRNRIQIQMPSHPQAASYRITGRFRIADPLRFARYLDECIRARQRGARRKGIED
ncbi:FecR family protein [Steroidobacter sp.]|uniref:FecR family protein n=1 Tax=Steroidobacter sp. TaxID=1978227 RepID=UPI001A61331E|nr:FecR domain-containing protein [Steroidobacter sp.]MBL8268042.1 FecR domain-containing protein [Steroidobacter sp.]